MHHFFTSISISFSLSTISSEPFADGEVHSICWGSTRSIQFLTPILLHSESNGYSVQSQLPLGVKVRSTPWRSRHFTAQKTNTHTLALSPMFMSLDFGWKSGSCKLHAEKVHGHRIQTATVNSQGDLRALPLVIRLTMPFHAFSSIHLLLRPKQTEMPIKLHRQVYSTEPLFI